MVGRALHFVFKVADRALTSFFYRDILGMTVLRHEEFTEGCEAACNGPYDNRWSKTMVGYGPEDTHFAIELTYNYNVDHYKRGNDFIGISIESRESIARAKANNWPLKVQDEHYVVEAPGGYKFFLQDVPEPKDKDPIKMVTLSSSKVERSVDYWKNMLGLNCLQKSALSAILCFDENQAKLKFNEIDEPVEHAEAYGRIAFSVPFSDLPKIQDIITDKHFTILKPMITLDTPGKASVTVVILADPDGHEICFVDDENFRKLSTVDPRATSLLDHYIEKDKQRQKAKEKQLK